MMESSSKRRSPQARSRWVAVFVQHRVLIALLVLVTATITIALSISHRAGVTEAIKSPMPPGLGLEVAPKPREQVDILMSFDEADAPGFAVAARSILQSAADPSLIHFHLVVSPRANDIVRRACTRCLDGLGLQGPACNPPKPGAFCCDVHLHFLDGISTDRETVVGSAAERIKSPFNAARFDAINAMAAHARRIAFLDPDIAVIGDVHELVWMELEGQPAAMCPRPGHRGTKWPTMCFALAALDCKNRRVKESLQSWGMSVSRLEKEWLGNAGIMVIDTQKWVQQGIGDEAKTWMDRNQGGKMWTLGTQPPTNLALLGRRARIPQTWNTGWNMAGLVYGVDQAPKLMHFKGPSHKAWRASVENMRLVGKRRWWAAQRYYDLSVLYHEACFVGSGSTPAPRVASSVYWTWDPATGTRVPAAAAGVVSRQSVPFDWRRQPVVLVMVLLRGDGEAFLMALRSAERQLEAPWPWTALHVMAVTDSKEVYEDAVQACLRSVSGPSNETCRAIERISAAPEYKESGQGVATRASLMLPTKHASREISINGREPFVACRQVGGQGLEELLPFRMLGQDELRHFAGTGLRGPQQNQQNEWQEGRESGDRYEKRATMARQGLRKVWKYVRAAIVLVHPEVQFKVDPAGIALCPRAQ